MKLHEKLSMQDQIDAMKYMKSCKWWKLMEERLTQKKLQLIDNILLKKWIKNGTAYKLEEKEIDQYRKELVDIDWLLKIPDWYIDSEVKPEPKEELEKDMFEDVLWPNVL